MPSMTTILSFFRSDSSRRERKWAISGWRVEVMCSMGVASILFAVACACARGGKVRFFGRDEKVLYMLLRVADDVVDVSRGSNVIAERRGPAVQQSTIKKKWIELNPRGAERRQRLNAGCICRADGVNKVQEVGEILCCRRLRDDARKAAEMGNRVGIDRAQLMLWGAAGEKRAYRPGGLRGKLGLCDGQKQKKAR